MQKIKEFIKKYMIGLTLSFLICISVVSAVTYFDSNLVTYENKNSGLKSTDVQGAIDELYNVCLPKTGGEAILDKVDIVSSGDGLYKDEYEDRYFYRGANPNNYIIFNNELWRIVSVESDGTIKIMREASIGDMVWDKGGGTYGSNNWARPSDLNTYLNGNYLTETLNSISQNQIVAKDWSIGKVTRNDDIAGQIQAENSSKWNGKVALITASEYIRSNSNQSSCGTYDTNNNNYSSCKNTTWMQNQSIEYWWTLSPGSVFSYSMFSIYIYGYFITDFNTSDFNAVRPSVYLSSKIKITGGDGSQNNPYRIE